jgi:hypothetical protein
MMMVSLFAFPIGAQQQVTFECRDMAASGNYLAPNETIINGKACRPAGAASEVVDAASPASKPTVAVAAVSVPVAKPVATPAVDSTPAATPVPATADVAPKALLLEDGTVVHLVLGENVSSADAVTGQTVDFEVVDDVVVNGFIVIPRGSTAWATVTDAEHKRRMGRAGHVNMNIDKVRLADGEKALLRAVKDSQGGSNTGKMVGAMAVTAIFTLGGSALFLLAHGKDTTIPKGTAVTAFVQGSVTLDQSKFQKQPVVQ